MLEPLSNHNETKSLALSWLPAATVKVRLTNRLSPEYGAVRLVTPTEFWVPVSVVSLQVPARVSWLAWATTEPTKKTKASAAFFKNMISLQLSG
ncbi:hypothetical protein BGI27_09325 [Candidatus Dactylopiibacterium carminicum]|uniref:Uncharacterized protein n=1 Tax=Candidatus Dactylopiibacterium carminicum TaxID=857335 RepID=A0ABQ7HPU4_9RHOO|nr:hypothetical protein BGI27_09325 [Candidatus Dactylopiibacterium carminicum]